MEFMEKTLTSKLVYDGGLLKVHYDTVELINGRTSWREVIRHPGAVVMVPIDDEDNIYLGKGQKASSNGELVAKVVRLAKELGREVANPDEARKILSLG